MPVIRHSFDAKCSPSDLWEVLYDLTSVAKTNPLVSAVEIVSEKSIGVGATRRCELRPKGTVTERVWAYDEGRAVGIEVVESDWPVVMMSWKTEIAPRSDGARIDQRLEYRMKFGPIGWLLNALVLRRAMTKNVGEALKGVIRVAEGLK